MTQPLPRPRAFVRIVAIALGALALVPAWTVAARAQEHTEPPDTARATAAPTASERTYGEAPAVAITEDSCVGLALPERGPHVVGLVALALSFAVHRNVSIGLYRLHVAAGLSTLENGIFGVGGAPGIEASFFPDPRIQPMARLAAIVQGRTQTAALESVVQAAIDVVLGVRFWVVRMFAIAPSLGFDLVLTDSFLVGDVALPQWTPIVTLGLELGVHVPL